ncbi:hypothetical protein N657DRAFT_477396 [Parathielavia appendiculata]|uniref:Uncharacterized protein n=1 Tax=Parathielavia appendiculata TaxID=2587402 RepID=A0AAN6Z2S4_9PEZI|nr:hypothetical protein N657DRAFT_477396 [Parathielavia appendiculata]
MGGRWASRGWIEPRFRYSRYPTRDVRFDNTPMVINHGHRRSCNRIPPQSPLPHRGVIDTWHDGSDSDSSGSSAEENDRIRIVEREPSRKPIRWQNTGPRTSCGGRWNGNLNGLKWHGRKHKREEEILKGILEEPDCQGEAERVEERLKVLSGKLERLREIECFHRERWEAGREEERLTGVLDQLEFQGELRQAEGDVEKSGTFTVTKSEEENGTAEGRQTRIHTEIPAT